MKIKSNILIDRSRVNQALRLGKSLSFEMFPPIKFKGKIKLQSVLSLLRYASVNGAQVGSVLPSDLMTLKEASEACGVSNRWFMVHVRRGDVPCFVLSRKMILVPRSQLEKTITHKTRKVN